MKMRLNSVLTDWAVPLTAWAAMFAILPYIFCTPVGASTICFTGTSMCETGIPSPVADRADITSSMERHRHAISAHRGDNPGTIRSRNGQAEQESRQI
jgi:hypothetical protein